MAALGPNSWKQLNKEIALNALGTGRGRRTDKTRRFLAGLKPQLFSIERRRVLVPLVNQHKSQILAKFPEADFKDIVDSVEIIFHRELNKHINGRDIFWLNARQDVLVVTGDRNNDKELGRVLTKVRQAIRQQALNIITNVKKTGAQKEEAIQTSFVLAGTDPRFATQGGDILQTDIDKGLFITKGNVRLAKLAKTQGVGFEAGHVFGAGAQAIDALFQADFFESDIQDELKYRRDEIVKIDSKLQVRYQLLKKAGGRFGEVSVQIAETAGFNAKTGGATQSLITSANAFVRARVADIADRYSSSDTIIKRYVLSIDELFLKGKVSSKTSNFKRTYKTTIKGKKSLDVRGPKLRGTPSKQRSKPKRQLSSDVRLIIDLLNRRLHDQIRKNMGKGRSKQVLNYRTGRFAKSAIVKNLIPSREKNAILAQVKYMRNPYGVFEKGGHLYKPLRDPKGIFGRSIRQILQEEKIANLRRVKVELSG